MTLYQIVSFFKLKIKELKAFLRQAKLADLRIDEYENTYNEYLANCKITKSKKLPANGFRKDMQSLRGDMEKLREDARRAGIEPVAVSKQRSRK